MIKAPTFTQYLAGLTITLCLFGLTYLFGEHLQLFTIDATSPFIVLLAGLVVGQLIGTLVIAKPADSTLKNSASAGNVQTIYVGNLPFKTNRNELRALFEPFGKVHSARIMIDKVTRKPRGYGFVEMESRSASRAINKLNGTTFDGRNIKVNEATQRS